MCNVHDAEVGAWFAQHLGANDPSWRPSGYTPEHKATAAVGQIPNADGSGDSTTVDDSGNIFDDTTGEVVATLDPGSSDSVATSSDANDGADRADSVSTSDADSNVGTLCALVAA